MKEIEILQKRLDFVTSMKDGLVEQDANMNEIKYFASEFLIQRFLGLNPDDLRVNKKLKEIEDREKLESAKKAAEAVQGRAFEFLPYVPTAQFILPTAYRTNLSGIIVAPMAFLWNVEKK